MTATPALDWLLRGGLCSHETRAACPVCSRTEAEETDFLEACGVPFVDPWRRR